MAGTEVVINPHVVLIAVHIRTIAQCEVQTHETTNPTVAGSIQSVANRKIVCRRHSPNDFTSPCARIEARPIGIAAEDVEGLKLGGCR